jgi:hypothetical protein
MTRFVFERLAPDDGYWQVFYSNMITCALVSYDSDEPTVQLEGAKFTLEELETLVAGVNR